MNPSHDPEPLKSGASLVVATGVALVLAAVVSIAVVLPAEYGIDPTGVGQRLGLTDYAAATSGAPAAADDIATADEADENSTTLPGSATTPRDADADSAAPLESPESPEPPEPPQQVAITVPAGAGVEYKFLMRQHERMTYTWVSDGTALYHDLHGEPEGDTSGYFESYVVATAPEMSGSFVAPFDGSHGWYWRNDSDADVNLLLTVEGQFEVIGLK